jgi:hypothetical protein
MVSHVPIVSILMIVNGSLASVLGIILALFGPAVVAMISADEERRFFFHAGDKAFLTLMTVFYIVVGVMALVAGVLNIVAGARSLKFRGRGLALTALFCNILPLFTCYCAPTSLGLMIYGLIVFFNGDVAQAFRMAEEGMPVEEIRYRFSHRRPPADWHEDEDYGRWER